MNFDGLLQGYDYSIKETSRTITVTIKTDRSLRASKQEEFCTRLADNDIAFTRYDGNKLSGTGHIEFYVNAAV